jgi:hypothetical protein
MINSCKYILPGHIHDLKDVERIRSYWRSLLKFPGINQIIKTLKFPRFRLSLISLLFFLAGMTSCTEIVDIELDSTYDRLIVYGEVTNRKGVHTVSLTRSADYFSNQKSSGISGAIVEISDGENITVLTESSNETGIYETDPYFFGTMGKTYKLNISNVDIDNDGMSENYSAQSFLPFLNPLDSIFLGYSTNSFFSGWQVLIWAQDPPESRDFYSFKTYKNGILLTDTLSEYIVQSDDFFNGSYTNGITAQFLNDANPSEKAKAGDIITFEINAITEEFYKFVIEAGTEASPGNPLFSGPPANIRSNISNGGLGFFTAYSLDRKTKVVPELVSD